MSWTIFVVGSFGTFVICLVYDFRDNSIVGDYVYYLYGLLCSKSSDGLR